MSLFHKLDDPSSLLQHHETAVEVKQVKSAFEGKHRRCCRVSFAQQSNGLDDIISSFVYDVIWSLLVIHCSDHKANYLPRKRVIRF